MENTKIKHGDVFRWHYTDDELKRKNHGDNGGTTYWAASCVAIANERGELVDTWSGYGQNMTFNQEDIGKTIEVTYLGNINDYRKADKSEQAMYLDSDCMDINHANSSKGNFYIKKDAVINEGKKRKIIQRNIRKLEAEIKYQLTMIKRYKEMLVSGEMKWVQAEDGVSVLDTHYEDESGV